jgi:hypothetical protein
MKQRDTETGAGRALRRVMEAVDEAGLDATANSFEERNERWKAQFEKKSFMARKTDYKALKARCADHEVDVGDMLVAAIELVLADSDLWARVQTRALEIDGERPRK